MDDVNRGRRTLMLLALVFLGPMALAMGLYFSDFQWRPQATTEHGELYRPVRPLPDFAITLPGSPSDNATLHGKWTLLHIGPGECGTECDAALVATRQVRRALGRDMERVQRVFLVTSGNADHAALTAGHPDIGLTERAPEAAEVLAVIGATAPGEVYLIDPLGNLVMRYPAHATMKGMHTDLQRLLKVSTIG